MRALLFDVTKCIGCGACSEACLESNRLPAAAEPAANLGPDTFTVLKTLPQPSGEEAYYRRLCMHCLDPACASVCPVGALEKTANGPVVYHEKPCLGCRYCIQACAFNVPRYEWDSLTPRVRKCTFCSERLMRGESNACAEACPAGATMSGTREELLKEAHRRIAEAPDSYVNHVYGEREAGGTSVLVLSPIPFDKLELPLRLPAEPLPVLTFEALSKIPAMVGAGSFLLAGLWWFTRRKEEVALAEGKTNKNAVSRNRGGEK
ncbi:MAG: 4Fe-4S dicluster domain-containing protein [Acidimicrobiia bacterium]|nr:4Fe-4S dicluster domain-containing protein [Acidimicrobiia bacterium]